jgi:hypothetical protein
MFNELFMYLLYGKHQNDEHINVYDTSSVLGKTLVKTIEKVGLQLVAGCSFNVKAR